MIVLGFVVTNCQKSEEEIINQTPAPENIVLGSPLAGLISRTAQNPTSSDNVLDGSSNIRIKLPVTVTVNGIQVNVLSVANYQTVKDIKDAFTTDNDIVYFSYPITVEREDYSSYVISNYNDLDDFIDNCGPDNGLNDISCISINYPITINFYNTNNQVASSITIQNNIQLYTFIFNLTPATIAAIVYPISIINSNNQNVVINSNSDLENFIESSIDDCDDDSGGSGNPTFTQIITTGTWYVSYSNHEGDVNTNDYNGYSFTFNSNNTISVVKNSMTTSGTWSNYIDSGENKLNLNFSSSALDDLSEDWRILEYTQTVVRLKHVSGGDDGTDYLNFTKL
jgi:hypothetical protein